MGPAMLAGVGVGLLKDLGSVVEEWVKTGKSFRATAKQKRIYKQRICAYGASEKLVSLQGIIQKSCVGCIMMLVTDKIITWR